MDRNISTYMLRKRFCASMLSVWIAMASLDMTFDESGFSNSVPNSGTKPANMPMLEKRAPKQALR